MAVSVHRGSPAEEVNPTPVSSMPASVFMEVDVQRTPSMPPAASMAQAMPRGSTVEQINATTAPSAQHSAFIASTVPDSTPAEEVNAATVPSADIAALYHSVASTVPRRSAVSQINSTATRYPRLPALMAARALRSEALRDPADWSGASQLSVPDMQHHVQVPRSHSDVVASVIASRKRMWNQPAPVAAGKVACTKCCLEILGVVCWEGGVHVHFGCATDATRSAVVAGTNRPPEDTYTPSLSAVFAAWRGVSVIARGDLFRQFCFDSRFALQRLEVSSAFGLSNRSLELDFESAKADLFSDDPCVLRLYHGTSHSAAQEICTTGFKLPPRSGMFGKGLYFSNVPDKCIQYAPTGFVLVCDVALGCTKRLACSMASLQSPPDGYDSVTGLTFEEGGALRAPEYVVYKVSQALPRYLLVLRR